MLSYKVTSEPLRVSTTTQPGRGELSSPKFRIVARRPISIGLAPQTLSSTASTGKVRMLVESEWARQEADIIRASSEARILGGVDERQINPTNASGCAEHELQDPARSLSRLIPII